MANFRVPAYRTDYHETKGSWLTNRTAPSPLALAKRMRKTCHLFELPAELRVQIYEWVYTPATIVKIADPATDVPAILSCHSSGSSSDSVDTTLAALHWHRISSKWQHGRLAGTKWGWSLSGLILASKRAYVEAMPIMYAQNAFHVESSNSTDSLKKTTRAHDLKFVRWFHLHYVTVGHGMTVESEVMKEKADEALIRRCRALATALPDLTELEINLRLLERPDQVVPDFTNPKSTFTTSQ